MTSKTTEGNHIKKSWGLDTRLKSTNLLYALNIDKIKDRIDLIKCKFLIRLLKNTYTRDIIWQILNSNQSTIKNTITYELINIAEVEEFDLDHIITNALIKITQLKTKLINDLKSEGATKIRSLMLKEYINNKKDIEEMLRSY